MWTSSDHTCLLLLIILATTTATLVVTHAEPSDPDLSLFQSHLDEKENRIRRDALRAISNPIKERDVYLSHLWQQYENSSRPPTLAKEILDALTNFAYLDSRLDLIGLLLFGPRSGWSVSRALRTDTNPDPPGLKSTFKLFEKHCGVLTLRGMKQSLANMYHYVAEKEALREAIILACRRHKIESHGINVTNPKVHLTPAPVHGSYQYCGRVSVNATPRLKVESYAKTYQVTVVTSQSFPAIWHNLIHICFHRNESLGLCQCEKDDWRPIQKGSWSFAMPPYDQRFVDVKFLAPLSPSVTVTLDIVSPAQEWLYGLLVGGAAILLFMAVSKYIYAQDGVVQFVKRATCVLAVTCISMDYIGTLLTIVTVASCLALYYTITSIM